MYVVWSDMDRETMSLTKPPTGVSVLRRADGVLCNWRIVEWCAAGTAGHMHQLCLLSDGAV